MNFFVDFYDSMENHKLKSCNQKTLKQIQNQWLFSNNFDKNTRKHDLLELICVVF